MRLLDAPEDDYAYAGALLFARALRTVRDWDAANRKPR